MTLLNDSFSKNKAAVEKGDVVMVGDKKKTTVIKQHEVQYQTAQAVCGRLSSVRVVDWEKETCGSKPRTPIFTTGAEGGPVVACFMSAGPYLSEAQL